MCMWCVRIQSRPNQRSIVLTLNMNNIYVVIQISCQFLSTYQQDQIQDIFRRNLFLCVSDHGDQTQPMFSKACSFIAQIRNRETLMLSRLCHYLAFVIHNDNSCCMQVKLKHRLGWNMTLSGVR